MSIDYTYSKASDFPSGLDSERFALDIQTSSITIALDHISTEGDVVLLTFKAVLSPAEETALDTLVAAHVPTPVAAAPTLVVLDGPREDDKRPIVTFTPGRDGWKTWLTSFGDDVALGPAGRGLGPSIYIEYDGTETFPSVKSTSFQFDTPVEMHDGQVNWGGDNAWGPKDFFSFSVSIPATVGAATGTGNANLIAPGGVPLFVPAAPGTGSHQIDLATAAPIPKSGAGWDCDLTTGILSASSSGGSFMLAPYPLEVLVIPGVTMGSMMRVYDVDVYRTDWVHPSWTLTLATTKTTPGAGWVSGWLFLFRPSNLRL